MPSVNKVIIIGHLARDPEVRATQSGASVCNMTIATDESFKDRDGNPVRVTEWHRVTAFGRTAENCGAYLRKGSLAFVEGSLQTRKWQDKDGQDRYTPEIKVLSVQFLDRRQDGGQPARQRPQPQEQARREEPQYTDDVPF